MPVTRLPVHQQAWLARLNDAFAAGDEGGFEQVIDDLFASRTANLLKDMHSLSHSLLAALTRFRSNARVATLAVKEVPEAQVRLDHVLKMTEQATHRTLDIVEQTLPLADATARGATHLADTLDARTSKEIHQFLLETSGNAEQVRRNLADVMLAQGFQDLTGQILQGVRTLVGEVESVLQELASIAGIDLEIAESTDAADTSPQGPMIPGVTQNAVSGQSEADDLMAELGI
jgi:chemotaxis protein CheZ